MAVIQIKDLQVFIEGRVTCRLKSIERAKKSGVAYIAQTGGSVRDDHVIDCCDKYGITMAFTGIRLFHH